MALATVLIEIDGVNGVSQGSGVRIDSTHVLTCVDLFPWYDSFDEWLQNTKDKIFKISISQVEGIAYQSVSSQ